MSFATRLCEGSSQQHKSLDVRPALPAVFPGWPGARSWQRRRAKKLQRATQACGTGKSWPTSKKIRLLPAQSVQFGGGRSWRLLKRSKTIAGSTEVERMRDRRGVSPFRLPLSPRRLATRSARPGPGENAGGASGASGASETCRRACRPQKIGGERSRQTWSLIFPTPPQDSSGPGYT